MTALPKPHPSAFAVYWRNIGKGEHFAVAAVARELGISSADARRRLFAVMPS
jgi:hypothetical protein